LGSATASARIEFPAHLIDEEIKEVLASQYDIAFGEDGQPQCDYMDVEVEIMDAIFGLHDRNLNEGEFEALETLLVRKGVPFDRCTNMDWSIEPRLRVFRPGGVDDAFLVDPESFEPVIPVSQIRALLEIDDAGEAAASAIRRYLDEHFPAYPPLADWVKKD
jgi:hypothetical protein